MCGPLATFAIGALSSVASFAAQNAEAAAVQEAAQSSYEQDQTSLSLRQIQEEDAAAQKLRTQRIEEAKMTSEVEVSAAEAGVAGISVENLVADVGRQSANARQNVRNNLGMTLSQLQLEKKGSRAQNQGRINSAPRPSPLGLIAGIGAAGVKAYEQSIQLS